MSLGEKLKYLRLKSKTTLNEQGRVLNVSMNSVYRWEHGIAVPRNSMIRKIAAYYCVPVDWLLSDVASSALGRVSERALLQSFKKLSEKNKNRLLLIAERMTDDEFEVEISAL